MGDVKECKKAAKKAMDLLLRQDRTKKELQERLYRSGFSEEVSCYAIEYVEGFGYINDRRYAENYIAFHKGSRSRKELRYKLAGKGIPDDILVETLMEYTAEDEEQALSEQIKKRLKGRRPEVLEQSERNKIVRYLAQKGFGLSAIKRQIEI